MIKEIPRISVLIICYKQEQLIGRALNSLLSQKDYLYEICVSDDCSPDNTWEVLKDYQNRYPDLIKLHRNEPNVGIFENFEQSWTMPTGDVIYQLSGDDEAEEGWFKKVVEYILNNGIDYKNDLFCIYGDFKVLYPNGDTKIAHHSAIQKYPNDALRLALRGIIGNRGSCFSINVLNKFDKVSQGRSHIAEMAQDRMLQLYSEHNYYIPHVGNIYHSYVGISTQMNEEILRERSKIRPYAEDYLESRGVKIASTDKFFGKYIALLFRFRVHPTFSSFVKIVYYFIKSLDRRMSFAGEGLRDWRFAIMRRLPHNKPIYFK